jgi:hypothetical protein
MIDSYSFGQIIVNGKRYTNDVIIFPNRIRENWYRKEGHCICIEDLEEVIQEKPEILVVGAGYFGFVKIPAEVKENLKDKGIELITQPTKDACKTFNSLLKLGKKVVAALHIAC